MMMNFNHEDRFLGERRLFNASSVPSTGRAGRYLSDGIRPWSLTLLTNRCVPRLETPHVLMLSDKYGSLKIDLS